MSIALINLTNYPLTWVQTGTYPGIGGGCTTSGTQPVLDIYGDPSWYNTWQIDPYRTATWGNTNGCNTDPRHYEGTVTLYSTGLPNWAFDLVFKKQGANGADEGNGTWVGLSQAFAVNTAVQAVGAGRCLDVKDGSQNNNTPVQIYDCNGTNAQTWTYNIASRALTVYGGMKCLDWDSEHTKLQIYDCNGTTAQQWALNPDGTITGQGGCLDVAGTSNGTPVDVSTCSGTTQQQRTGPVSQAFTAYAEVRAVGAGRCLDVQSGVFQNGTPVQIYDCNGTEAQAWTYNTTSRALAVYGGTKCLDWDSEHTKLQIYDCYGYANQQWTLNPNGTITGDGGLCLDVAGTSNGTPVDVSTCSGTTQQQWAWVGQSFLGQGWSSAANNWVYGRWATPVNDFKMHNVMTLIGPDVMVALYSADNRNLVIVVQQIYEARGSAVWDDRSIYQSYSWDFVDNAGGSVPGQ
ncbi:MAG: ricin-type beta-trefoil lectin domain protein [Deltaproteobacteria bacterium]|nr:ricin-type beta-trefoil lectin domain protein [Deltaproteobacteria bacterium]